MLFRLCHTPHIFISLICILNLLPLPTHSLSTFICLDGCRLEPLEDTPPHFHDRDERPLAVITLYFLSLYQALIYRIIQKRENAFMTIERKFSHMTAFQHNLLFSAFPLSLLIISSHFFFHLIIIIILSPSCQFSSTLPLSSHIFIFILWRDIHWFLF